MSNRIREILSSRKKQLIESVEAMPAAVLIPLFKKDGKVHILFTKRTETVAHHKGQICFPGGASDPEDETSMATALREAFEEVGVRPEDVDVLGTLDDLITSSNFLVAPFVGTIPYPYNFKVSRREVEELIEAPLAVLMDKNNVNEELELRGDVLFPVYFYHYKDHVIWGVTARLLTQFLELLRKAGVKSAQELE